MELDRVSVALFSILMMTLLSLVFYLGMSYGKSTRSTTPEKIVVRTLKKDNKTKNNVRPSLFDPSEAGKTAKNYEKILNEILNETKTPPPKNKINPSVPPTPTGNTPVKNSPAVSDKKNVRTNAKIFYTVQIMATSQYKKASDLIKELKNKKFEAYIQNIPLENGKVLYRVRVGRSNKITAESVKMALQRELKGIGKLRVVAIKN